MADNDRPASAIQVEDEILQVLFWMRGEGLQQEVDLPTLARFLTFNEREVAAAVDTLAAKNQLTIVSRDPTPVVTLSETGLVEGGRRFRDEFESYLGHDSHLVCDDPNCDCHSPESDGQCTHLGNVH